MKRRGADWVTIPACSIAVTKGAALPSMIGTSGPSTSMVALSTPMPRSAASTCSAVETSGPSASPSTVANSVAITASDVARTSRSPPSMPLRTKIKPASTDAGPMVRLTGSPECTPTPVTVACERSVVCRLNFIRRPAHYDSHGARPTRYGANSHTMHPQVAATIITALNSANSRFFTDCYPIRAAFTPRLNQIRPCGKCEFRAPIRPPRA